MSAEEFARIDQLDGEGVNNIYLETIHEVHSNEHSLRNHRLRAAYTCSKQLLHLSKGARTPKIEEGMEFLKQVGEEGIVILLLKSKFLGWQCSESTNKYKNAQRGLEIYKLLLKMELNNRDNRDVIFVRAVMTYYDAGFGRVEKFIASTLPLKVGPLIKRSTYNAALDCFNRCEQSVEVVYYKMNCFIKMKNKERAERLHTKITERMDASNLYERELIAKANRDFNNM